MDKPVSPFWQGLDEAGVVEMIIESVPELADRMAKCFLSAPTRTPNSVQQRFASDQLTGRPGEAEQHFHSLRRQVSRPVATRNLPLERLNEQIIEIEAL